MSEVMFGFTALYHFRGDAGSRCQFRIQNRSQSVGTDKIMWSSLMHGIARC